MAKKTSKLTSGEKSNITRWFHNGMSVLEISEKVNVTTTLIKHRINMTLAKDCEDLWKDILKRRSGGVCEITKKDGIVHCHHLLEKGAFPKFRYDLNNGIVLHESIHEFGVTYSPHYSSSSRENFRLWLIAHKLDQYDWWDMNRENKKFVKLDLYQVYDELKEVWDNG